MGVNMAAEGGGDTMEGVDGRRRRRIEKTGDHKQLQVGDRDSSSPDEDRFGDDPVVTRDKAAEEGVEGAADAAGGDLLLHGEISVIGRRREMEDAVRVALGFVNLGNGRGYDFYGVYDGHGGSRVADFCRERLHQLLVEELGNNGWGGPFGEVEWDKVMAECFSKADDEVRMAGDEWASEGSTAVVAVVGDEVVVIANCGDSRAVISRDRVAVALSEDHKPNRPDELTRIQDAGGKVIEWGGHRILGVLATSRSIGDQFLKPYVISDPEVRVSPRTNADEFLILGSDGLWDVITNEYACRVVRMCLKGRMKRKSSRQGPAMMSRSEEAATLLTELAMARGSSDNISVIVVELNSKKFSGKPR